MPLQRDAARLRNAYLTSMHVASFASAPIFLFMAAAAPELIPGLFGNKWHDSVPVMQIFCLYGPLNCLLQFNAALLTAIGRPRTVFRIAVAGTIMQVTCFAIAVNFGIEWVAASYVVRAYLIAPVGFVIASRALGNALWPILRGLVPIAFACVLMVLSVEAMRRLIGHSVPDLVAVMAYAAVALPVYLLTMRLIAADYVAQATRYAQAARPGGIPLLGRLSRA